MAAQLAGFHWAPGLYQVCFGLFRLPCQVWQVAVAERRLWRLQEVSVLGTSIDSLCEYTHICWASKQMKRIQSGSFTSSAPLPSPLPPLCNALMLQTNKTLECVTIAALCGL